MPLLDRLSQLADAGKRREAEEESVWDDEGESDWSPLDS